MTVTENETYENSRFIVAVGNFDGVHEGHAALIKTACAVSARTGAVPAVFTFDGYAPKGGAKHIIPAEERGRLFRVSGISAVFSHPFDSVRDMTPAEFCRDVLCGQCRAAYVVCGYDFRFGKGASGDAAELTAQMRRLGCGTVIHDEVKIDGVTVSSTAIRRLLADGDTVTASRMLGRPFSLSLPVIHGSHIGTGLGFPTINQDYPDDITPLRFGVYATDVIIDGVPYRAVTNVGVKPTVGGGRVTVESHVLDCDMDLYGKNVMTQFKEFIRPERRFGSLEELKAAITADTEKVREKK